jgi:hypothetical protein
MRVWPALIAAPLLALLSISLGYALVPAACGAQKEWLLLGLIAVCLVLCLLSTAIAYSDLARHKDAFLPLVATWCGAFFSLVVAAQGMARLFLSPCTS